MTRTKNFSREDVIKKAIPLFWKHGFADTSLQDLEKATGVNKSGLYSEFKNKEDIYLCALQHYLDNRGVKEVLVVEPLGWNNLEKCLAMTNYSKELKGCLFIFSIREYAALSAKAQKLLANHFAIMRDLILANVKAEKTRTDAEVIAEMILLFFSGSAIEQSIRQKNQTAKCSTDDFIAALKLL